MAFGDSMAMGSEGSNPGFSSPGPPKVPYQYTDPNDPSYIDPTRFPNPLDYHTAVAAKMAADSMASAKTDTHAESDVADQAAIENSRRQLEAQKAGYPTYKTAPTGSWMGIPIGGGDLAPSAPTAKPVSKPFTATGTPVPSSSPSQPTNDALDDLRSKTHSDIFGGGGGSGSAFHRSDLGDSSGPTSGTRATTGPDPTDKAVPGSGKSIFGEDSAAVLAGDPGVGAGGARVDHTPYTPGETARDRATRYAYLKTQNALDEATDQHIANGEKLRTDPVAAKLQEYGDASKLESAEPADEVEHEGIDVGKGMRMTSGNHPLTFSKSEAYKNALARMPFDDQAKIDGDLKADVARIDQNIKNGSIPPGEREKRIREAEGMALTRTNVRGSSRTGFRPINESAVLRSPQFDLGGMGGPSSVNQFADTGS
jgi:hypothetical protein